jgi:hypothetical protein
MTGTVMALNLARAQFANSARPRRLTQVGEDCPISEDSGHVD